MQFYVFNIFDHVDVAVIIKKDDEYPETIQAVRKNAGCSFICCNRRIADVCFELHFRVTPGQFRSAAASSLHRRLALLATSTRPSCSKNAYLGILFAPMYQKYSLDFVSFSFYSNIQIV